MKKRNFAMRAMTALLALVALLALAPAAIGITGVFIEVTETSSSDTLLVNVDDIRYVVDGGGTAEIYTTLRDVWTDNGKLAVDETYAAVKSAIDAAVAATGVSASAVLTDNAVVRGDGGGYGTQTSGVLIDDSDNISGFATATADTGFTVDGLDLNADSITNDATLVIDSTAGNITLLPVTTGQVDLNLYETGGASYAVKWVVEEVTIAVGSGADPVVTTSGNLAPAGVILDVRWKVTDAPGGGATELDIGITGGDLDGLTDGASCDVLNEYGCLAVNHAVDFSPLTLYNGSATTLTLTTDGDVTGDQMVVEVAVAYLPPSYPPNGS